MKQIKSKSKPRLKKFVIRVSIHHKVVVRATNSTSAKYKVWNDIKDGYTYGFKSKHDFMKGTNVVE
jgi:hypothetical protein